MTGDGFFFSLMVGLGETYLPAFVLAMGLGEVAAGLIASLPMLAGAVLQLLTPAATRRLGSYKRWVVACASIQACSFLPLMVAAWMGGISTVAVFGVAAVYWGFGMATGPAWNTWAEQIVPRTIRPKYFAGRTRFAQTGVFLGFVAGGLLLQAARSGGWVQIGFGMLFLAAGCCRFLSALCLSRQTEMPMHLHSHRNVSIPELWGRLRRGGSERLLVYLITVQFAVYISGPYFNPFMLKQLGFSYQTYMMLVAAGFLAKALAMPLISVVADRFGTRRLLWFGAAGMVPLSSLWIFSQSFGYLMVVQLTGGIFWAAYELAMLLLFFEIISREERTSLLTWYNLGNSVAMVMGSLLGGGLLKLLGERPESYMVLFGLSSVVRLTALGFLSWMMCGTWLKSMQLAFHKQAALVFWPRAGNGSQVPAPVLAAVELNGETRDITLSEGEQLTDVVPSPLAVAHRVPKKRPVKMAS